jgi:hypothetical protein
MDEWIAGPKNVTAIECVDAPASGGAFTIPSGISVLTNLTKL